MTRRWLLATALGGAAALPLAAQTGAQVGGRVLRPVGADTVAAAGARVVLHRIAVASQGPVDSTRTDPAGRFRFRARLDTTATYLVSARHAGIEYFSVPLGGGLRAPDSALTLLVFDTSSAAPVVTRSRTLVIGGPDPAGLRTVIDWMVIENGGILTRVGSDSTVPTWRAALPAEAANPSLGDPRLTPFSPDAVRFRNDSVLVLAPLSPGSKELVLQYDLPGGRGIELPLGGIDSTDVFLEERDARVGPAGWAPADSQNFQGRVFRQWTRAAGPAARLTVDFPGLRLPPGPTLVALVAVLGLGLAAATYLATRRARGPGRAPPSPAAIADRIARLDRDWAVAPASSPDREGHPPERERLLAELRAALAARGRRS